MTDYRTNPMTGEFSVGIPGEFSCIREVYKYARFNWKKLTKPAIELAQKGFKVSKHLAHHLEELNLHTKIAKIPFMADIYLKADGQLVKENDIIVNLRLVTTLEKLRDRPEEFYEGSIGDSIVEKSKLTKQDLRDYRANMDAVSKTSYNDFVALTAPFPSNGPIVGYTLKMMETLNLKVANFKTSDFVTHLLQASAMGYKMSAYTADPASFTTTVKIIYENALE